MSDYDTTPNSFLAWAYRHLARTWITALSGNLVVIFFILFATLGAQPPDDAPGAIDLQLAFREDTFRDILTQWGPDAVQTYQDNMWLDFLFPLMYAVFLSSAIAVLTRQPGEPPGRLQRALFVLPYLAVPFDLLENTLHLLILRDEALEAGLIALAAGMAAVKWALLAVALAAVMTLFAWRAIEVASGQKRALKEE